MVTSITFLIIFIIISASFSASETAIFSLSSGRLHRLSERYSGAKTIKKLLKKPTRLLSTIVFGNLLVNIGFSALSTTLFISLFGEKGILISMLFSGVVILFLGEIFPKTFAIYNAEKLSLFFSPLLNIVTKVFAPFIILVVKVVDFCSNLAVKRPQKTTLTDEEFKAAIFLSKKDGQITAQEESLISHVLEFKDTQASEVLTARIDMQGIDTILKQKEVIRLLKEQKHSKFPVYEGSQDNIIGILYAKDVFLNPEKDYHQFLREPVFVPESKKIDDILKLFLETKERVVIVLDDHGGTEGIITLEDIVEEIFGEIYDEYETVQEPLERIGDNQWKIYAKTPIKTVNIVLGLELPEEEDTMAGFILSQMERIPRSGEKFKFANVGFTVERATKRKIISIKMTINKSENKDKKE